MAASLLPHSTYYISILLQHSRKALRKHHCLAWHSKEQHITASHGSHIFTPWHNGTYYIYIFCRKRCIREVWVYVYKPQFQQFWRFWSSKVHASLSVKSPWLAKFYFYLWPMWCITQSSPHNDAADTTVFLMNKKQFARKYQILSSKRCFIHPQWCRTKFRWKNTIWDGGSTAP